MSKKIITGGQSLPFPAKPSGSIAGRTMQESVYSPLPEEKRLPDDTPNILIVLIDDAGPGEPDTFGGEVHTPTLERIYNDGIGYNRFHTTAMCSPTGALLLTGRNHHRIGNGQIAELANGWDGFSGMIPPQQRAVGEFVAYYNYNHERYHESLDNMTPADVYFGRAEDVKTRREEIKQATLEKRRQRHRKGAQDRLYLESESSLIFVPGMSH